jgi:hypothetical protein
MKGKLYVLEILGLAMSVVLAFFLWEGNKGFNLWDEGFLWYGVQRVMVGEVPIRDFLAYDPGRYFWSALIMSLSGNKGIMTLRIAAALFEAIGLFIGLLLIARSGIKKSLLYILLSAITLTTWMFLYYKVFDITLSILLIGTLTFLIENPTNKRYFLAGLFVGLIAVFGRNHGVYGVAGSIGVIAWLQIKRVSAPEFTKGFACWAAGVAVGFTPIFCMALVIPGFAVAFWESVRFFLFEFKATNLPLPIPWPWLVKFAYVPLGQAIREVLIGLLFMATIVLGVLSIIWIVIQRLHGKTVVPTLVAASFLALPYAHYAYSRADDSHVALGIFPLLVGCLAVLTTQPAKVKWSLALMLCGASVWITLVHHPGWQSWTNRWVNVEISGNKLVIDPATASDVELLRRLTHQYAPHGQSFIAVPFWPGAYAVMGRKSPMWDIYPILPRRESFEREEIERIKMANPRFVFIYDVGLDGREALRFQNSHPLEYQYIIDHFERLPDSPRSIYQIYNAKGNSE